jgi:hypothetical protein
MKFVVQRARFWTAGVILAGLVLSAGRSQAASIGIDSRAVPITMGGADFDITPFSFNVDGANATFSGSWFSPGADLSGSGVKYFLDANNFVRDILSITFSTVGGQSSVSGSYQSNLPGSTLLPAGFTGEPQSNSTIIFGGGFLNPTTGAPVATPGYLAFYVNTEDPASVPSETPEPSAISLAALGLGLLSFASYRKFASQL